MEHEEQADALEAETEDMEALGERVSEHIDAARSDWESKKSSGGVPGALTEDAAAPGGIGAADDEETGGENPDPESGGPE
jgi:hypothetical protein